MADIEVKLRPVTWDDWALLLQWRNDPETRAQSVNTDEISEEIHKRWLKAKLESTPPHFYILLFEGQPAGTIRADFNELFDAWELSWMLAPEARGKGLGKAMLKAIIPLISGKLMARIKPENTASEKMTLYCGFRFVGIKDGLKVFEFES